MNLTRKHKKILTFLKKKEDGEFHNIENIFGKGTNSYGQSNGFKNLITDLEEEGYIETQDGYYINNDNSKGSHRTLYFKELDINTFGQYTHYPKKARIKLKGNEAISMSIPKSNGIVKLILGVIAIPTSLFILWGRIGTPSPKQSDSFSICIRAHNNKNTYNITTSIKDSIILDLKGRRTAKPINANGEVTIPGIPKSLLNTKVKIGLKSTKWKVVDDNKEYKLIEHENGGCIYLEITSKCNSCIIAGRLIDNQGNLLRGEEVCVCDYDSLCDTTNGKGYFMIEVPKEKEKPNYNICIIRESKIIQDFDIAPNNNIINEFIIR